MGRSIAEYRCPGRTSSLSDDEVQLNNIIMCCGSRHMGLHLSPHQQGLQQQGRDEADITVNGADMGRSISSRTQVGIVRVEDFSRR